MLAVHGGFALDAGGGLAEAYRVADQIYRSGGRVIVFDEIVVCPGLGIVDYVLIFKYRRVAETCFIQTVFLESLQPFIQRLGGKCFIQGLNHFFEIFPLGLGAVELGIID